MYWYIKVLKNYAVLAGRARRQEYWMFVLVNIVISIALRLIDTAVLDASLEGVGPLYGIYGLGVMVPSITVTVRRLHDIGKSGWYLLLAFIPIIGGIWLVVLTCLDSQPGDNQYGPSPKMADCAGVMG